MAKTKVVYLCDHCGAEYRQWQGHCPSCDQWNSITVQSSIHMNSSSGNRTGYSGQTQSQIEQLPNIDLTVVDRIDSGFVEFDRVLGGGIVPGSAILIGGSPGAGKSTLLLQIICQLATHLQTLYVTGEESLQQVAMRAQRLQLPTQGVQLLAETNVEIICTLAAQHQPKIMIIDSIQVMHLADISSAPGSISQVRECAAYITRFAKQHHIAVIMVGHITKEGQLAGPKVLEHCIDCSIMIEGQNDSRFRTIRANKNRFGAINEFGVFAMTHEGLKEVKNPSAIFLNREIEQSPGSAVIVLWEGTRPLLVELQALVDQSALGNPRRVTVGIEQNRISLLLAVLHKHGGLYLTDQDIFVNVVGGIKVTETSADLAVIFALISSFKDQVLPENLVVFGEVGLSGEIRPINSGIERIKAAAKHGFTQAIVPKGNEPKTAIPGMVIHGVKHLQEAIALI